MEIKRHRYLKSLIDSIGNGLVKIVIGLRRCGKSYLLFHLFKNYLLENVTDPAHLIELDFDSFENIPYRKAEACYRYIVSRMKDDGRYFILLDEIQMLEDFEAILNSLMKKNADIFVTGSNSRMLSKDVATEFRGRGWKIPLFPLSWKEFRSSQEGRDKDSAFDDYLAFGGMPFLAGLRSPKDKVQYLSSLFEETYLKDIVGRYGLRGEEGIQDVLRVVSSSVGSFLNVHRIGATFQSVKKRPLSDHSVSRYLEILEDAFLLYRAKRYSIRGRKYIGANDKFYFADNGLRNAILGFRQVEPGHLVEQTVYLELLSRGYSVDVGLVDGKDADGTRTRREVDFVCNLGSKRVYMQASYSVEDPSTLERELAPLRSIPDSFPKVLIAGRNQPPYYDEDGILRVGLFHFLGEDIL